MSVEFGATASGVAPRPAATVVLLREGDDGAEVLLLRRRANLRFMGGAHVFPGGKVDESDAAASVARGLDGARAARRLGMDPMDPSECDLALALHSAAARECLEEAGLTLELEALAPLARWITPPEESRRFDTRFFLAEVPAGVVATADQGETVEALWITPARALEQAREGTLVLVPPTYRTVELLAFAAEKRVGSWASLVPEQVPLMMPRVVPDGNGFWVVLPGDPLHSESCPPQASAGRVEEDKLATRFRFEEGRWIAARGATQEAFRQGAG